VTHNAVQETMRDMQIQCGTGVRIQTHPSRLSHHIFNKKEKGQAPVAHDCDPSHSRGGDQDCCSKPAPANSSRDPISKNPSRKRATGVIQGVGSEFKTQCHKKKKERKKERKGAKQQNGV
jgi:hypothetical protein